jgi:hypothetical protein
MFHFWQKQSRKIRGILILASALFCMPSLGMAQEFTPSELDTLVANIALYPDPLLVQVLAASTYSEQIAPANTWAQSHRHLSGKDLSNAMAWAKLPYDASVQALIPFPTVLAMMAKYPAWTDQLGDAVIMQKDEVMAAIQRLRHSARDYGHLVSDDRIKVSNGDNITILPVRTEYVYIPVYNPYVVYYRRADGYVRVTYGPGIWIGDFTYWGWGSCWFDWGPRIIYVHDRHWRAPRRHHHPHRYAPPPPRKPRHDVGPNLGGKHNPPPRSQTQPKQFRKDPPPPPPKADSEPRKGNVRIAPRHAEEEPRRLEDRPKFRDERWNDRSTFEKDAPSSGTSYPPPPRRSDDDDRRSGGNHGGSHGPSVKPFSRR